MKTWVTCLLIGLAGWTVQRPLRIEAAEPRTLDESLLDDSASPPRRGVDGRLLPTPAPASSPDALPGRMPAVAEEPSLEGRLAGELGEAAISEDAHPLLAIAGRMRDVQARLAGHAADPQTAAMQQQIVAELDRLLEEARNQASAGGEASRQAPPSTNGRPEQTPPGQPGEGERDPRQSAARESTDDPGPAGSAEEASRGPTARHAMETLWNQLPARRREQLLQLAPERFLPKYETEIEEYFRRLSEETP